MIAQWQSSCLDHNRFRVRISVASFCIQGFNQRRNLLRCSKDISGGPRDLPPQRVRPQITSAVSPIRECSRVILLQNKFNSLPIYLHTPSGDIVPGHRPRARRVNFKPTSSGTSSACHKAISKSHFVGSPVTRTFVSVRFRATRPFLNKTPSSTT